MQFREISLLSFAEEKREKFNLASVKQKNAGNNLYVFLQSR